MLKMRAVITLLVLLISTCGSLTLGTQTDLHTESQSTGAAAAAAEVSTQLDVSAELRELRDMVGELRVTLSFTRDELQNTKYLLNKIEAENKEQDTEMTAVKQRLVASETRLAASETEVVNLRKEAAAQTADLGSVTERVAVTETDMEHVQEDTAAKHTDLTTMKTEVEKLKLEQAAQEAELVVLKTRMDTGEAQVETRLSASKTEVEKLKMEHAAQEAERTAVKTRLTASETELVNLTMEAAAQTAALRSVTERLVSTETDMEQVKKDTAAQEAELIAVKTRLTASETELVNLTMEAAAQTADLRSVTERLSSTETEVVNLEKEIRLKPKVAFSAGLTNLGFIFSGNTELNLVFTKTIINVGQAYSNSNGFFTAPVKGVYYFRFTVTDLLTSTSMYIRMVKNGVQVMQLVEYDSDGNLSYLSSGVTLQLEVGDVVNMRLPEGKRLYDDYTNQSTFSGFLLFPL